MATTQRLNVEVVGNASGFIAMMNRVTSGVTRFGSGLGSLNRNAQQSNRLLQAMSTTLRYAFAGRVVYGIQNAVNNLADFKSQLGEIDALAGRIGTNGNFVGLGGQLDQVGKQALLMSNKFGVSVGDVESYMQRFYTSFKPTGTAQQNLKQMQDFVTAHLQLVTMLGSRGGDPNALAGGLAALVRTMPGGEKNAGSSAEILSNYFAQIIKSSPTLQGQDIANAAGRLASAKTLSGMSTKDILATFGLAAETGGSSAVITRGITQLLGSSLLHPTRPQSLSVYQQAGLPTDPNQLLKLGGTKVLESLIKFVQKGGPQGSKGRALNLDAIYNAFSRQESVRQFVNLLANGGVNALDNYIKSLDKASKSNLAAKSASDRLAFSTLTRMKTASTNLGMTLVSGADTPIETLIANPTIWASNLAIKHPNYVKGAEAAGLSLYAANSLRKLGVLAKIPGVGGKLGSFLSGATSLEKTAIGGAITKEELPGAISGVAGDGSRAAPLWVIIAPLSWQLGGPATSGNNGGGLPKWVGKVPLLAGGRVAAGVGAGFILGKGAYDYFSNPSKAPKAPNSKDFFNTADWKWGILHPVGMVEANLAQIFGSGGTSMAEFNRAKALKNNPALLNALAASGQMNAYMHGNIAKIEFAGNPKADLTIKLVDAQGRTITVQEKKGVPILPKAKTFPSSQGKAGSRKAAT